MNILKSLTSRQKELITRSIKSLDYPAGQIILREGDPAYAFYSIIKGEVEAHRGDLRSKDTLAGTLGDGEIFGAAGLVFKKQLFTIKAKTKCTVMCFPNNPVELFESIGDYEAAMIFLINMIGIVSERLRLKFTVSYQAAPPGLQTTAGYEIDETEILKVIRKNLPKGFVREFMRRHKIKAGEYLFKQGRVADGFFFVRTGSLEVQLPAAGKSEPTKLTVYAPNVLGQPAFFSREKYGISPRALETVEYTKFIGKDFNELRRNSPRDACKLLYAATQLCCLLLTK